MKKRCNCSAEMNDLETFSGNLITLYYIELDYHIKSS